MISKGAYIIQDKVRRSYSFINNLSTPDAFFVRGRLTFFQGMKAISVWFRNMPMADVLAHRFFMERQSYPAQASPQMHLTDEIQNVARVVNGLQYMRDDGSKLDNTMMIATDYDVPVFGQMLCLEPQRLCEESPSEEQEEEELTQLREEERLSKSFSNQMEKNDDEYHNGKCTEASTMTQDEFVQFNKDNNNNFNKENKCDDSRWTCHEHLINKIYSNKKSNIINDKFKIRLSSSLSSPSLSSFSSSSSLLSRNLPLANSEEARERTRKRHRLNHLIAPPITYFPSPEQSSNSQSDTNARYFHTLYCLYNNLNEEETAFSFHFPRVYGGYTVLYNPIETNERTVIELLLRLHEEQRVVCAIILPTRQSYRQAQLWADAFPTATIYASGPVPIIPALPTDLSVTSLRSVCQSKVNQINQKTYERSKHENTFVTSSSSSSSSSSFLLEREQEEQHMNNSNDNNNDSDNISTNKATAAKEENRLTDDNEHSSSGLQWRLCENGAFGLEFPEFEEEMESTNGNTISSINDSDNDNNNNNNNNNSKSDENLSVDVDKYKNDAIMNDNASEEFYDNNEEQYCKLEWKEHNDKESNATELERTTNVRKQKNEDDEYDEYGKLYHFDEEVGNDDADEVFLNPSLFKYVDAHQAGIRSTDAHRIHLLDECATSNNNNNNNISSSSSNNSYMSAAKHLCSVNTASSVDKEEDRNSNSDNSNATKGYNSDDNKLNIPSLHSVLFTPRIACYRIDGDVVANEYVLYDAHSQTLACTDVFYGDYSDLDLLNTWICRVWFKFMRQGNFHNIARVPRFKWLQVLQQETCQVKKLVDETEEAVAASTEITDNISKETVTQINDKEKWVKHDKEWQRSRGLTAVRRSIDLLTRHLPIKTLIYAHGTSPLSGYAANALRLQWGMKPFHPHELPHNK